LIVETGTARRKPRLCDAIKNCRRRYQRVKLSRVNEFFSGDNLQILSEHPASESVVLIHA
jgi:hypothetical protein